LRQSANAVDRERSRLKKVRAQARGCRAGMALTSGFGERNAVVTLELNGAAGDGRFDRAVDAPALEVILDLREALRYGGVS
jgi:hypothetical protein